MSVTCDVSIVGFHSQPKEEYFRASVIGNSVKRGAFAGRRSSVVRAIGATGQLEKGNPVSYQTVHYTRMGRYKVIDAMAPDANPSPSIPVPSPNKSLKTKRSILLVSADGAGPAQICDLLSQHGFGVAVTSNIAEVDCLLEASSVDLVLVDLNLGAEVGLHLVTRLALDFPVVVIGDEQVREADKVRGLECGADDYIVKPFGKREFVARLRVCLRPVKNAERSARMRTFSFADWSLNTKSRILRHVSGEETKLSAAEFNVLLTFLDHPQTILSREEIIAKTRLNDGEVVDRSIDVLILRLRRKIECGSHGGAMIQTVRGKGYVFAAPVQA